MVNWDDLKLIEPLAALAHQQWSNWMRYLFSKGRFTGDGEWIMPKSFADRWLRQMNTPFHLLPEEEQKSDYQEAEHYRDIFASWFVTRTDENEAVE